jgi:hypothetical protein
MASAFDSLIRKSVCDEKDVVGSGSEAGGAAAGAAPNAESVGGIYLALSREEGDRGSDVLDASGIGTSSISSVEYPFGLISHFIHLLCKTVGIAPHNHLESRFFEFVCEFVRHHFRGDVPKIKVFLRDHLLDIMPMFLKTLNWCIEKTYFSIREHVHETVELSLFDILENEQATIEFVHLCFYVFTDTKYNSGVAFTTAEMLLLEEKMKAKSMIYFMKLKDAPVKNKSGKDAIVVTKKHVENFKKKEETMKKHNEKWYIDSFIDMLFVKMQDNPWVFKHEVIMHPYLAYLNPRLLRPVSITGYFLRLLNQALHRKSHVDWFNEELIPHILLSVRRDNGLECDVYLQKHVVDKAGDASAALRAALIEVAPCRATETGKDDADWYAVLEWVLLDRKRMVRLIDLVVCRTIAMRSVQRKMPTILPTLMRRMELTAVDALLWFEKRI